MPERPGGDVAGGETVSRLPFVRSYLREECFKYFAWLDAQKRIIKLDVEDEAKWQNIKAAAVAAQGASIAPTITLEHQRRTV